jgi:hypothetical protein
MEAAVEQLLLQGVDNVEAISAYDHAYSVVPHGHIPCLGWEKCKNSHCYDCDAISDTYHANHDMPEWFQHSVDRHGDYGVCGDRLRCNICKVKLDIHKELIESIYGNCVVGCLKCCDLGICTGDLNCVYCKALFKYEKERSSSPCYLFTVGR